MLDWVVLYWIVTCLLKIGACGSVSRRKLQKFDMTRLHSYPQAMSTSHIAYPSYSYMDYMITVKCLFFFSLFVFLPSFLPSFCYLFLLCFVLVHCCKIWIIKNSPICGKVSSWQLNRGILFWQYQLSVFECPTRRSKTVKLHENFLHSVCTLLT